MFNDRMVPDFVGNVGFRAFGPWGYRLKLNEAIANHQFKPNPLRGSA
jgi:hypothetical protein